MTIKIVFITSGLGIGGAEIVLFNLIRELDRTRFEPFVISLTGHGPISDRLKAIGINVHHVNFRERPLRAFATMTQLLRRMKPNVVQTWMYHGDLIGSLAARAVGLKNIAWSLHNIQLDPDARMTNLIRKINARLSSRVPRIILSCSEASASYHAKIGYAAGRIRVIPNGFDTDLFRPDSCARSEARCSLNLHANTAVVLHLGRLDPMKNHAGFLRAAALVSNRLPNICFLMAGKGIALETETLSQQIRELGLEKHVRLLGPREDVQLLMAGCDALVQTSISEAFPMVLGEAMSCGLPCVATDVGDSAIIVGETGYIVPAGDDIVIANAIELLLTLPIGERLRLGRAARKRIIDYFDIKLITRQYEAVYLDIAGKTTCAD